MKPELETIVGERVSALRKLKNNPHDKGALGTIFKVQQQVSVTLHTHSSIVLALSVFSWLTCCDGLSVGH